MIRSLIFFIALINVYSQEFESVINEVKSKGLSKTFVRDFLKQNPDGYFYQHLKLNNIRQFKNNPNWYIFFSAHTGTHTYEQIAVMASNGEKITEIELSVSSDHDGSVAISYSSSYEVLRSKKLIEIKHVEEFPIDKTTYSDDGYMIGDYSFHEVKTTSRNWYTYYQMTEEGLEFVPCDSATFGDQLLTVSSRKILDYEDIKSLNIKELRIARNEIFARKGYIFKSKDLNQYFRKQTWYHAMYENVNNQLNLIEKLNVQYLKNMENEEL